MDSSGLQTPHFFINLPMMRTYFYEYLLFSGAKMSSPLVAQLRCVTLPRSSHDRISGDEFLRKIPDLISDENMDPIEKKDECSNLQMDIAASQGPSASREW